MKAGTHWRRQYPRWREQRLTVRTILRECYHQHSNVHIPLLLYTKTAVSPPSQVSSPISITLNRSNVTISPVRFFNSFKPTNMKLPLSPLPLLLLQISLATATASTLTPREKNQGQTTDLTISMFEDAMCRSSVKGPMVWEKVVYRILYSFNASMAYQLSRPLHCDEQIDFNTDGADTWVASGFCDNLHGNSTKCLGFHLDSGESFPSLYLICCHWLTRIHSPDFSALGALRNELGLQMMRWRSPRAC